MRATAVPVIGDLTPDTIEKIALAIVGGGGLFGWWSARRKNNVDVQQVIIDALRAELDRRDAECERRLMLRVAELRAEAAHRERNMRQAFATVMEGRKLTDRQRAILDGIAPDEGAAA